MGNRPFPRDVGIWERFPSEMVAENVRAQRVVRRMSQEVLARNMVALGHTQWSRAAVSEVERHGRQLTINELFALAHVFHLSPCELLRSSPW